MIWTAAAVLLTACGGDDDAPPPAAPPAPARGSIVSAQLNTPASPSLDKAGIDALTAASGLQAVSGPALCDIDRRTVVYNTIDHANQPATASAGVIVPVGTDAACTGNRPVLLYTHGTEFAKTKDMSNVEGDLEAGLLMAFFASQGYIVVAPNYLGYSGSSLDFHPYLNAEAQANDVVDGLRASVAHLEAASATKPSGQLFVAGYSQGGHVAMATQRLIETSFATEFTVTASGPMSGPYNLRGTVDAIILDGRPIIGGSLFFPLLLTSYEKSYGDIYASPSDVYNAPFDQTAETLFPTDTSIADLVAAGRLPVNPAEGRDQTFTNVIGDGSGFLLKESVRTNHPGSGLQQATDLNTVLGWTPQGEIALCGGDEDPVVFFDVNTPVAQADFASRGVTVAAFNVEEEATLSATLGATGTAIAEGFKARKDAAGAGFLANYHAGLVPPACFAAVRAFFTPLLQP